MSDIVDDGVKGFWDNNHRPKNVAWLGNPSIQEVYRNHEVLKMINGGQRLEIMEIGVGVAESVKYLSNLHNMVAVDISPQALSKVDKIAKTYLTENMEDISSDSIDLAFSNLTIPHCSEEMVDFLISQTLRIIKEDGLFCFQSGYCREMFASLWEERMQNGVRINYLDRDEDKMKEIIDRNGGKIVHMPPTLEFKRNNITWNFFHIRRK